MLPSTFEENLDKDLFSEPWEYVEETSRGKATEVAERMKVSCPTCTGRQAGVHMECCHVDIAITPAITARTY